MADEDPYAAYGGQTAVAESDPYASYGGSAESAPPTQTTEPPVAAAQALDLAPLIENAPPALEQAAQAGVETAAGFVPRSVEQAATMAGPAGQALGDIVRGGQSLTDVLFGRKPVGEAATDALPSEAAQALALTQEVGTAEKTPAYSKERFKAGFDVIGQIAQAALGVRGAEIAARAPLTEDLYPETARPVEAPVEQPEPTRAANQALARLQATATQPEEPPVQPGAVRLYHGGAGEQAGSDFSPFRQYAQGYADKTSGGKVWYVDVPEGSLKTHDEYGVPVSRVVVPDEIANEARPIEGGEQPSAIQEPKTGEILQRQPQEAGAPGGERGGVEQGVQGQEIAGARPQEEAVARAEPPPLPADKTVTIKANTPEGEELEVPMKADKAGELLKGRRDALQNLLDCLGAA